MDTSLPISLESCLKLSEHEKMVLAVKLHKAGRLDVAEVLYQDVITHNPYSYDALHLLGLIVKKKGHLEAACHLIRTSISIEPAFADQYNNLANTLIDLNRPGEAVRSLLNSIILRPETINTYLRVASVLTDNGLYEDALKIFESSLSFEPGSPSSYSDMGVIYRNLQNLEQSFLSYQRALRLQPDHPEAHMNLSVLYKNNPVPVPTEGDIVIYQHHPGLGDNLIYSTLPELFAARGQTVYISDLNNTRNPGIHELVWKRNPYVKGISTLPPNAGSTRVKYYILDSRIQNVVSRIEFTHGFESKNIYPKIYYEPKRTHPLAGRVLVDLHSVTGKYTRESTLSYINFLSSRFGYRYADMVQIRFPYAIAHLYGETDTIETYVVRDIFDYCDAIASAHALATVHSGANSLASAIRGNAASPEIHCLISVTDYNDKAYVWPNVDYVVTNNTPEN